MKKICLLLISVAMVSLVSAQKYVPKFSTGSVLSYNVFASSSGQQIPLLLSITSISNPLDIKWEVQGFGTGTFEISAAAIDSASKMRISQPQPDKVTKFKDDQTIMIISKKSFADLTKNQTFILNDVKFTVVADDKPFKINDKDADVFHLKSDNGQVQIWVLNNPDFPLVCQLNGNPQGIDLTLLSVKE